MTLWGKSSRNGRNSCGWWYASFYSGAMSLCLLIRLLFEGISNYYRTHDCECVYAEYACVFMSWQTAVIIQHSRSLLFAVSLSCWLNPDTTAVFLIILFYELVHVACHLPGVTLEGHLSLSLFGSLSLQGRMELSRDFPEDQAFVELMVPEVSSETDFEHLLKDTEEVNLSANRSVWVSKHWLKIPFLSILHVSLSFISLFITFRNVNVMCKPDLH